MPRTLAPKSEKLPKFGTPLRSVLISHLDKLEDYRKNINKGIRLFTTEELNEIKGRYEDGLTWDDIDRELSQKGILLKKATFRKYIQDGYLPKPTGYRNTGRGRVALFPADTISHINFIQYFYKVASGEVVDKPLTFLRDLQISYLEAVESQLTFHLELYASLLYYICFSDGEAYSAISEGLSSVPEGRAKALRMMDEANAAFESHVEPKIRALMKFLKSDYLLAVNLEANKENQE